MAPVDDWHAIQKGGRQRRDGGAGAARQPLLAACLQESIRALGNVVSNQIEGLEQHRRDLVRDRCGARQGRPRGGWKSVETRRPEDSSIGNWKRLSQRCDTEVGLAPPGPGRPWIVRMVLDDVDARAVQRAKIG